MSDDLRAKAGDEWEDADGNILTWKMDAPPPEYPILAGMLSYNGRTLGDGDEVPYIACVMFPDWVALRSFTGYPSPHLTVWRGGQVIQKPLAIEDDENAALTREEIVSYFDDLRDAGYTLEIDPHKREWPDYKPKPKWRDALLWASRVAIWGGLLAQLGVMLAGYAPPSSPPWLAAVGVSVLGLVGMWYEVSRDR